MNYLYGNDGLVFGSFVYMLVCHHEKKAYIKIGVSDNPLRRMDQLRCGCPFDPVALYTMKRPSRKSAFRLERTIHRGMKKWRTAGEWFAASLEQKSEFNEDLRRAVDRCVRKGYPGIWVRMNMGPILADKASKGRSYRHFWKTCGAAFRDFKADSRGA